jgi:hypothetical protein
MTSSFSCSWWRIKILCPKPKIILRPTVYTAVLPYSLVDGYRVSGEYVGFVLDGRGVRVRVPVGGSRFPSPRHRDCFGDPLSPPVQWVSGVKRPGRETDHTSNECRNMSVTPPYMLPCYPLLTALSAMIWPCSVAEMRGLNVALECDHFLAICAFSTLQ